MFRGIFQPIHRNIYPNVYLFPTERTTFITLPLFNSAIEKSSDEDFAAPDTPRSQMTRKASPLMAPVNHFLEMILEVYQRNSFRRLNPPNDEEKSQR